MPSPGTLLPLDEAEPRHINFSLHRPVFISLGSLCVLCVLCG